MILFLVGRVCYAVAVLVAVASLVFGLLHLSGDPLAGLVPPGSSPEQEDLVRRRFGLDRPLPEQYARFLARAARGDLGESWTQRRPALDAVLDRLPATLILTALALAFALLLGGGLALLAARRPGGVLDALVSGVALLGQAVPGFWLGTLLVLLFAVRLRWLPSSGNDDPRALVLPALTLAVYPTATVARLLRASLVDTLRQDYIRTARGKGLPTRAVLRGHALRPALLPTLAFAGLQAGFLLGGAVVVEAVFAYPGIGRLALDAVADRDLPLVQAFVVVAAALIVLINLAIDALTAWLDPRLRFRGAAQVGG